MQEDIAQRVVGAAAVKLTRFERERALAKPTESLPPMNMSCAGASTSRTRRATAMTRPKRCSSARSISILAMPLLMRN